MKLSFDGENKTPAGEAGTYGEASEKIHSCAPPLRWREGVEPRIPDEVFRPTAHNSTPAMAEAITDGFSPSLAGCTHQACGFLAASS